MTHKSRADAIAYVEENYCITSDDNIETDARPDNELDFSDGEDGTWVRGWLFVPNQELGDLE